MPRLLELIQSKLQDDIFRVNFIHTVFLFYCGTVAGITSAITGPALLDLQLITNTDTQQASAFITGAAAGSIIGSLGIGIIYWRCNKVLLMMACVLLDAVVVFVLPWSSIYWVMIIMHGLMEMMRSSFCAAASTDIIRTWTTNSRIYVQIFNVCFSLGGMLAPIIVQPFLLPNVEANQTRITNATANLEDVESPTTQVYLAYTILGCLYIVGACMLLSGYFSFKKYQVTGEQDTYTSLEQPLPFSTFIVSILLLCLIFFFMMSVHISLISYTLTFVVTYLNWSKSTGASLTTVYWVCQAVWRFVTIFFTKFVSPFNLLLSTSVLTLLALVGNIFFSLYGYSAGLWVCIGLCGLGISTNIPSMFMWTEESITPVTPKIMGAFQIAITIPGIVTPLIIGYLMEHVSPMWLMYLCTIECGVSLVILVIVQVWVKMVVHKHVAKRKN